MGQGGGAVKVVKGSRQMKSTFRTHFRRVSGHAARIANPPKAPDAGAATHRTQPKKQ